jgi:FkbM family methyltransferase
MSRILDIIRPGDLVFDVGAHAGNKTARYLEAGARVVCFEPQPWRTAMLRERFGDKVIVEETALGASRGDAEMLVCDNSDTISTLELKWRSGRFSGEQWNRSIRVKVNTLDLMVMKYGRPAFCKIDVEGYERQVLAGLSSSIPIVSIEFVSEFYDDTAACVAKLVELGLGEFNVGVLERAEFHFPEWVSAGEALAEVVPQGGGDIYARVAT